jgi:hypothetical protein
MHLQPSPLLRRGLQLDGAVSGIVGLALCLAAGPLGALFGLPFALLLGAGLAMLPWALALTFMARRDCLPRGAVWAVIGLNALWVIESLWLLVSGWVAPSALGYAFVIGQAVGVVLFIELQFFGLKRSVAALV